METNASSHQFLICGFGSLGQYCVEGIRQFSSDDSEITFRIINLEHPTEWVIDGEKQITQSLIIGDCRDPFLLKEAGIETAQAALFVTSDERVNIQAALAARAINPKIRLVVRSSKDILNDLLESELGNFTAMNPAELPAAAFVNGVATSDQLAAFEVGGEELVITQHHVGDDGEFKAGNRVVDLQSSTRRIVSWKPKSGIAESPRDVPTNAFYQWDDETILSNEDELTVIQPAESLSQPDRVSAPPVIRKSQGLLRSWLKLPRVQPTIAAGLSVGTMLLIISTLLFKFAVDETDWFEAFSASVVLLTGGYGDLFSPLEADNNLPLWLQIYGLVVTLISLVFLLGVLGLIADAVIHSRLEFLRRKTPIPTRDHIVIIGYKRLARKVIEILNKLNQPFVILSLSEDDLSDTMDPSLPIVKSTIEGSFAAVALQSCRGIMLLTEDELFNIEMALLVKNFAREHQSDLSVVVRVFDSRFSHDARQIIPAAQVLAAYQLAGQAFAASALGEEILGLVKNDDDQIFIADYEVEENKHLGGRMIGDAAYGFGVIPVSLRRSLESRHERKTLKFPSYDLKLETGDHLTVLATINGLKRIEIGEFSPPPRWKLTAQPPLTADFLHTAGSEISRLTGCPLATARDFIESLPNSIELKMYTHQASRLKKSLKPQLEFELELVE
ncbi:MAG: NAD-binding protein [Planctomycetaceae bacterium]|nr:NAD-binding protein [Planctomycetaceae bacterium]